MTRKFQLTVDGVVYQVEVGDLTENPIHVLVNGHPYLVEVSEVIEGQDEAPQPMASSAPSVQVQPAPRPLAPARAGAIAAPMPGVILAVRVNVGDRVSYGQEVCVLEAMKMEQSIRSSGEGVVKAVRVSVGDNVAYNDVLVEIE